MEYNKHAFAVYENTFPSHAFLRAHFGQDTSNLDTQLRHCFDNALRGHAIVHLRRKRAKEKMAERVYVFKDGVPAEWVGLALERGGLMKELSPEALLELGREFIGHCRAGALYETQWWRWQTTGDSIYIEMTPGAVMEDECDEPPSLAKTLDVPV